MDRRENRHTVRPINALTNTCTPRHAARREDESLRPLRAKACALHAENAAPPALGSTAAPEPPTPSADYCCRRVGTHSSTSQARGGCISESHRLSVDTPYSASTEHFRVHARSLRRPETPDFGGNPSGVRRGRWNAIGAANRVVQTQLYQMCLEANSILHFRLPRVLRYRHRPKATSPEHARHRPV